MNKRIWLLVFGTALLFAGCSYLPVPTVTLEASATEGLPTRITVMHSITKTFTPEPTFTSTPLSPTWTPQPTLNASDAQKLLSKLLEGNGGCKLPCFWGITPGKTTWQEAKSFLEAFSQKISIRGDPENLGSLDVLLPFPKEMGTTSHIYYIKEGFVDEISSYNGDLSPAFYLTNFLNAYGSPDEVWIRTQAIEEQGSQPFEVVLFYPDQGILMDYSGGDLTTVGDNLRNCLGELDTPFIHLWNPSEKIDFQEAIRRFFYQEMDWPFISLEEAAGMDAKTFYESFKDPGNKACIVTPKKLWPGGQ